MVRELYATEHAPYVIQVCKACQLLAHEGSARVPTDGERVMQACRKIIEDMGLENDIAVRGYPCMGGCKRRCRVSFSGRGMWSWLVGDIDPTNDGDFLKETLMAWLKADAGLIPKPERSKLLIAKALGRVPPLDM